MLLGWWVGGWVGGWAEVGPRVLEGVRGFMFEKNDSHGK